MLFKILPFLNCVEIWTKQEVLGLGKRQSSIRMDELIDFLGLQLVSSVLKSKKLTDYCPFPELFGFQNSPKRNDPWSVSQHQSVTKTYTLTTVPIWQWKTISSIVVKSLNSPQGVQQTGFF